MKWQWGMTPPLICWRSFARNLLLHHCLRRPKYFGPLHFLNLAGKPGKNYFLKDRKSVLVLKVNSL